MVVVRTISVAEQSSRKRSKQEAGWLLSAFELRERF